MCKYYIYEISFERTTKQKLLLLLHWTYDPLQLSNYRKRSFHLIKNQVNLSLVKWETRLFKSIIQHTLIHNASYMQMCFECTSLIREVLFKKTTTTTTSCRRQQKVTTTQPQLSFCIWFRFSFTHERQYKTRLITNGPFLDIWSKVMWCVAVNMFFLLILRLNC